MAEYVFNAALNVAQVPMVTRFQPRSIIIGQLDNRLKDPNTNNTENRDNNPSNLPQALYYENIMPTVEGGVRSIGYSDLQDPFPGAGSADDVFILRDPTEANWYLSPAAGYNYTVPAMDGAVPWVSNSPVPGAPVADTAFFSIAYVNGETYICYGQTYLGLWDGSTASFIDKSALISGEVIANVKAITGAGNYLIYACVDNSVKWSSLTNPLDLVPSTETGAGSQVPQDIRGPLNFLSTISGGFICHCAENAVAALYTNNAASPWIFREVKSSGGVNEPKREVAKQIGMGFIYMNGSNGLQSLNLREAETIHPAFTEFIGANLIESFNSVTNLLLLTKVSRILCKVAFLSARFLCLSYGTSTQPYSYALIFDTLLKRWGKLKIDHVALFSTYENNQFNIMGSIHAIKLDGSIVNVRMDEGDVTDTGVLILGRYQINRTHMICSQMMELEALDTHDSCTVDVAVNYNGTTTDEVVPMTVFENTGNYRCFQKQIEGTNLSFIIKGTFSLATAMITATLGARQ